MRYDDSAMHLGQKTSAQVWPWEDASLDEMELAYRRMRAMFEFLDKLGVEYWCFHDRCCRQFMLSQSIILPLSVAAVLLGCCLLPI